MENYLTKEGLEKIKKELENLKTVERKKVAENLKEAASFGDLSENAAYDEAKEAQAFLEGKIIELEKLINTAKVVESNPKKGWVQIGNWVTLKNNDKIIKYQIVGDREANPLENKISANSPIGKALLNQPKDAIVEVQAPKGVIKYQITKID